MNKKPSPINIIWLSLILIATVTAVYTGKMVDVRDASIQSAKSAVTLAIGLIGIMALWLGIMKIAEVGGLMKIIAKVIRPVMIRLFPDVPSDHPAISAMTMNIAANALGLGNAATPMGIKAMQELNKLTTEKGTASNAMCLFLAINTSSVTILPLGAIAIRAGAGAANPTAILIPSIIATLCSTTVAIIASKLFSRKDRASNNSTYQKVNKTVENNSSQSQTETVLQPPSIVGKIYVLLLIAAFFGGIFYKIFTGNIPSLLSMEFATILSNYLLPLIMCGLLIFGYFKGVKTYEALTEGAKDGFSTAIRIVPFMVAIFVALGMFRASGALDIIVSWLEPITSLIGMPAEALPMALIRPLSGSGAFGVMSEVVTNDPDSFLSFLVSTMQGSTETTFYVLAVYFGSVGIKKTRHALPAALCADVAGIVAAVFVCRLMF